jgi:hypothetical protein
VSENFKHFTSFGEKKIYNDNGRINVQWEGSTYEHETFGIEEDGGVKFPHKVYSGEFGGLDYSDPDKLNLLGRWRFSEYIGHLGDLINSYVTDPVKELSNIAEAGRSGKSRFVRMSDGKVLLQSVNEIVFERVCRIPVPMQIGEYDDPETKEKEDLVTDYLKGWEYNGNDQESVYETAYHLREYSKWLSGVHSLARYHQQKHNWQINTEKNTAVPDPNNLEKDRSAVNTDVIHIDTYSTFRMMRDGSIMMVDGYGSSVLLGNGNVHFSASKHMFLEAAGDLNLIAGKRMHIKVNESIEVNSGQELKLRGKQGADIYSDEGNITAQSGGDIQLVTGGNVIVDAAKDFIINKAEDIYFKCKKAFSVANKMILDVKQGKLTVPKFAAFTASANKLSGTTVTSSVAITLGFIPHPNHVGIGAPPGLKPNKPLLKLVQGSSIIKNSAQDITKSLDKLATNPLTNGALAAATDVMAKAALSSTGVGALGLAASSMSNLGGLGVPGDLTNLTSALPNMAAIPIPTIPGVPNVQALTNAEIQKLNPAGQAAIKGYFDSVKSSVASLNPINGASTLTNGVATSLKGIGNPADSVTSLISKSPADMLKLGAGMTGIASVTSFADVQNLSSSLTDIAKFSPAGDFTNLVKGIPAVANVAALVPGLPKNFAKTLTIKEPGMLGPSSSSKDMYQSFTQQLLNATDSEIKTNTWDWSKDKLTLGKGGFPWPGQDPKHKAASPGGSKEDIVLTEPIEKDYKDIDNKAEPLKPLPVKFRTLEE